MATKQKYLALGNTALTSATPWVRMHDILKASRPPVVTTKKESQRLSFMSAFT